MSDTGRPVDIAVSQNDSAILLQARQLKFVFEQAVPEKAEQLKEGGLAMGKNFKCPACGEKLEMEDVLEVGDIFDCPECLSELELVSLKPLKIKEVDYSFSEDDEEEEDE